MKLLASKLFYIFLFIFTVAVLRSPCQSRKEARENKIKSTTEWVTENVNGKDITRKESYEEFDKKGNSILKIDYKKDGTIDKKVSLSYNNENKKSNEIEYTPEGEIFKKTTFIYNSNGDKTSEIVYNKNGQILKKRIYKYNSKELKIENQTINNTGKIETVKKWAYDYY